MASDPVVFTLQKIPIACIFFLLVMTLIFRQKNVFIDEEKSVISDFRCHKENAINLWYGDIQRFGQQGRPQRWVNVLGNICDSDQVKRFEYQLNNGFPKSLTLGSDLHRLGYDGDFNAELDWEELKVGKNKLTLIKTNQTGEKVTFVVTLIIEEEKPWVLPYTVDFSKLKDAKDVQSSVQIVDGLWEVTPEGLRTSEPYYDRVVTMGDTTWSNYEATARLTIHDFTPSAPGPPTYNVTHFGMAFRWRGHTSDGRQPSRQWYPLGAQGEFLLMEDNTSARWRILYGAGNIVPEPTYSDEMNFELGKEMYVKGQVKTMENGRTRYRYKQWMVGTLEPPDWIVEGFEDEPEYLSGALCLVPHNSDVTLHYVEIKSI